MLIYYISNGNIDTFVDNYYCKAYDSNTVATIP